MLLRRGKPAERNTGSNLHAVRLTNAEISVTLYFELVVPPISRCEDYNALVLHLLLILLLLRYFKAIAAYGRGIVIWQHILWKTSLDGVGLIIRGETWLASCSATWL